MLKFTPVLFGATAVVLLAGCSVTTIDYKTMTAADMMARPEFMPIMPKVPEGKVSLGRVEVTACQAKLTDPIPDHEDAYLKLKREAAGKGATALANVSSRTVSTVTAYCYTSVIASGDAYIN